MIETIETFPSQILRDISELTRTALNCKASVPSIQSMMHGEGEDTHFSPVNIMDILAFSAGFQTGVSLLEEKPEVLCR
jgi:hypothetical protein